MGLFDGIKDLFSGSQTTNQNSTNQGTSAAQSSAAGTTANQQTVDPRLKAFADWAASQAQTAFQPAQNLVQGAAAPTTFGQIQPLLNPFAQSQIQANFSALQPQFQDQLSQLKGSQSANPYASSNSGAEARLRGQQANTLGQISSGINSQSYGQALGAAQTDAARGLQAGQASGALTTSQLGQVIPNVIGAGGSTTAGSGTTSQTGNTTGQTSNIGNSTSTTQYDPSLFSIGSGLLGIAGGIPGFGGWANQYNPFAGYKADGGRVGYAEGGSVKSGPSSSFAGKVEDAFHSFHRMRKHAETGGKPEEPHYDDGGWVPTVTPFLGGAPSSDNGNPTTSSLGTLSSPFMDKLGTFGKSLEAPKGMAVKPAASSYDPYANPSLGTLSNVMGSVGSALGRRGYDEGGTVEPNPVRDILRSNYDYEKSDPWRSFRYGLLNTPSGLPGVAGIGSGFGKAMDMENAEREQAANLARQHAEMTGRTAAGTPTMQMRQLDQTRDIALGRFGDQPTLMGRHQAEAERSARLPKYEANTGFDALGRPIPGWLNPYNAPPEAQAPAPNYTGSAPAAARSTPVGGSASVPAPRNNNAAYAENRSGTPGSASNPAFVMTPADEEQFKRTNPGGYYTTQGEPTKIKQAPGGTAEPSPEAATAPTSTSIKPPNTPGIVRAESALGEMDYSKTGTEAFNQLPKVMQIKVAQALDGRIAPPTGMALKDPHQQAILTAAQLVDPTFDMAKWLARSNANKEFNSAGTKTRTKIESADKVISHINDLNESIDKLHNTGYPFGSLVRTATNPVLRSAMPNSVGVAFKDFETAKNLAMKEFQTFLSGKGGGADRELQELGHLLDNTASTTELKGVVSRMLKMMHGQLGPMGETYAKAFNLPDYDSRQFLRPETRAKLSKLEAGDSKTEVGAPDAGWTVKRVD